MMSDGDILSQIHLVLRLLHLFEGDDCYWLRWAEDRDELRFAIDCPDTFTWSTTDVQEITIDDLGAIAQAKIDSRIDPFWPILWIARKRQIQPIQSFMKDMVEPILGLFLACGPKNDYPLEPGDLP